MRKKLSSRKGETLVEVLASLLIVIMIISMLPMALETAARINARVKNMDTVCQRTMADTAMQPVDAAIYSADGTQIGTLNVQGYQENGFTYYVGKLPG